MNAKEMIRISKFLSLVLRHDPQKIGIQLDAAGWVSVEELLAGCARSGVSITHEQLMEIVASSDKQRFALSEDHKRIRANQGHSVEVQLDYPPAKPPAHLFHGTVERFIDSIRQQGILKGERHDVHLSETIETATSVGARRGRPVILVVRAGQMHGDGHLFRRTPNGVWLTDSVPPQYIDFQSA